MLLFRLFLVIAVSSSGQKGRNTLSGLNGKSSFDPQRQRKHKRILQVCPVRDSSKHKYSHREREREREVARENVESFSLSSTRYLCHCPPPMG